MNRRTGQNQRKVRISRRSKSISNKVVLEKKVEKKVEPSCEITGCGCGN